MTELNDRAIQGDGFATLNVATILAESAARYPEAPAVHFAGHTVPYAALWNQARAYAGALQARGIGKGSRVALMAPNVPDFMRVYYGALALGAIAVPVHPLFKKNEIGFVLGEVAPETLRARVSRVRVYAGYAGWGPGQLEDEIQANGWLHCPADMDLVFDLDLDSKYTRALAKIGIDPSHLVSDAGHA